MSEWLPKIDRNTCTGCHACIDACPESVLAQIGGKATLVFPELCTYCAACETVCPVNAIELPYLICKSEDCNEQTS